MSDDAVRIERRSRVSLVEEIVRLRAQIKAMKSRVIEGEFVRGVGTVYTHPDGHLTFACGGSWRAGLYADLPAIRRALRLGDGETLKRIKAVRPEGRPMTVEDLHD